MHHSRMVALTTAAEKIIDKLHLEYGPLVLYQSRSTCDDQLLLSCLAAPDFYALTNDYLLCQTDRYAYFLSADEWTRYAFQKIIVDVVPIKSYCQSLETHYNRRFILKVLTFSSVTKHAKV